MLALSGCSRNASRADDELVVTGSTTILPIAEQAAEMYRDVDPSVHVLVSGLGSSAGIEAVSSGTSDVGTSSRDLKAEEGILDLTDIVIAYDGIAVIVNPSNPVDELSVEQLRAIFSGEIQNWKDVGGEDREINLVNRDEASGTREAFNKIVMGDTRFDRSATVLPGTGQVRDVVARSEGAVGYISVGFVEPRFSSLPVKALVIDGVVPSEATVSSGEYPIARDLHFFTKGEPTGLARQWIDFVLSSEIQNGVVVDAGFVPVRAEGRDG
jgi:phosphate transport system substrate-binding protein